MCYTIMNNIFPSALHPYLEGVKAIDSSGRSVASTLYLDNGYYLKTAPKGTLTNEAKFTKWFHEKGLSVEVVLYLSDDKDYLLTRKAEGEVLTNCLNRPIDVCKTLATGLLRLHSFPISDFPVTDKLDVYIQTAEENYRRGCFTKDYLLPWIDFANRDEAWQVFQAHKHLLQPDVVVHGDYCLPNVLMKNGEFSGMIDLGQAGVANRHIDLYWALWSLCYNLGTDAYTKTFLDFYGNHQVNLDLLITIAAIETFV